MSSVESTPTEAVEGIVCNEAGLAIGICCNGQLYHGGKFATDKYVGDPTTPYRPGQALYAKGNLFTPDESETKQVVGILICVPGPFGKLKKLDALPEAENLLQLGIFIEVGDLNDLLDILRSR